MNYKLKNSRSRVIRVQNPKDITADAEGMTMRRWKYKEKRPTKVTIYNRYSARYRMSRAGVMCEEEEEQEEEEDQEETATATMRGTGGQARRRRYINNGSNKAGRKRGIKERRSKKRTREEEGGELYCLPFSSFSHSS